MADLAPIVLFVYNRPEHTRRTLDALAANPLASESDLIVYADGPKKPEHAASVEAARTIVRAATGFKSLQVIERPANFGLAKSVMTGVSEVCAERGRVIVVEDDLLVAPHFLTFLNQGLDRYVGDSRVFQISGYMFPRCAATADAFFLPLVSTWGWATWQRAWRHFDPFLLGLDNISCNEELRHRFNLNGTYDYLSMAELQRLGSIDSWGIRWYVSVFLLDGLTLFPKASLVQNIGVDGSGTHGAGHAILQEAASMMAQHDWQMPNAIEVDEVCLANVERVLRSVRPTAIGRFIATVRRKFLAVIRSANERSS